MEIFSRLSRGELRWWGREVRSWFSGDWQASGRAEDFRFRDSSTSKPERARGEISGIFTYKIELKREVRMRDTEMEFIWIYIRGSIWGQAAGFRLTGLNPVVFPSHPKSIVETSGLAFFTHR
jgi:hypothetical protein